MDIKNLTMSDASAALGHAPDKSRKQECEDIWVEFATERGLSTKYLRGYSPRRTIDSLMMGAFGGLHSYDWQEVAQLIIDTRDAWDTGKDADADTSHRLWVEAYVRNLMRDSNLQIRCRKNPIY